MATASQAAAPKGPSDAQETAEHQKMQVQRDYCIPIWHKYHNVMIIVSTSIRGECS